jgi:hypothetical protein
MENSSTLLTLLGGQPQVVTFLLDLLLARGEVIERVVVLYAASNPRYQLHLCQRISGGQYHALDIRRRDAQRSDRFYR